MFCETCDLVFCLMCVGGSHNSAGNNNLVEQLSISSPASNRNSIIRKIVSMKDSQEIMISLYFFI